jgi:hypothetical protein
MTTIDSSLPVDAGSVIDRILTGQIIPVNVLSSQLGVYSDLMVLIGEDGNVLIGG